MNEFKILVVDDTQSNLEILNELLSDKYDVLLALDGEFALEIAQDDKPDLILLDIMMPNMNGYEVCKRLKDNTNTKNIPIIFITVKTDEDSIEMAYDIGGADYVTKPFKPKELLSRVKKELKIKKLINELNLLASTDPMTKLYNRRYFIKNATSSLALEKRNKTTSSVMILDIDKFKNVNDMYGHAIGDDVIISCASILKKQSRSSDIVCRWGGEEFVIFLPNTNSNGALVIAEKIRKTVEELVIKLEDNQELKFTVSIGVSQVYYEKDITIGTVVNSADEALFEAKESGRNRVVIKTKAMD